VRASARSVAGAAVVVLTAAAPVTSAHAGSPDLRTVTARYTLAGGAAGGAGLPTALVAPSSPVASHGNEDRVRVSAADATGGPTAIEIDYTPAGATQQRSIVVCGSSSWLPVQPGSSVRPTPLAGRCPDGRVSVPTQGTISITFHRAVSYDAAVPAKRWAVIIGIRSYAAPTEPTYGGAGDANAVRSALLHAGWLPDHILDIRDHAATASAIERAMTWLVQHSGPDTFTLFHYSGHVCIQSRGPCGAHHTYLWSTDNRFIPETAVGASLSKLRGHAWVDIAGCEAGAFNVRISSKTRLFTASSQPGRTSYEEPSWHESVWAGLTWDQAYLQGAATGGAAYRATIGQMVAYGVRNTPLRTEGAQAGTQHPYTAGGSKNWALSAPPG